MKPHLILLLVAGSCAAPAPKPTPAPDTTVVEVIPDFNPDPLDRPDAAAKAGCTSACKRISELGCKGWAPDGGTCQIGCTASSDAMGTSLSLPCVAKAQTCQAALACLK